MYQLTTVTRWGGAVSLCILHLDRNWEAAPMRDIIATVPINGRDLHCAIDNEVDPERLRAIDIIGGQIATLGDKRLACQH